jgi:DNA-binding HxlR family transcriptional regulator
VFKKFKINCPVNNALQVISGKWKLRIVYEISVSKNSKRRFGELKRCIPEISEKMLIQELKILQSYGVVLRKAYPEIPPKVEYSLTARGLDILPIIAEIKKFGDSITITKQEKL